MTAYLRLVLILSFLVLGWLGIGSIAPASETPSLLEIPIQIDLRPLFRAADAQLPREAGHWQSWRDWHGIQTRYRAWRGPLSLRMEGDLLHVQAHVRYWARARKHVVGGFDLDAGCGVDEPSRQAFIGLIARLGFAPDWTLRPSFRVLPPRFVDGCEVTVLGIDVSPILGEVFEDQLEATLRRAMDGLRPRLGELRGQAEGLWAALQEPMEIAPGFWLSTTPLALALAPPLGRGDSLHTALGLAIGLRLAAGAPPLHAKRPLPPLQAFLPRGEGVRFDLSLELDYGGLGQAIGGQIDGRIFEIEGRQVTVEGVGLAAKRGDLVLALGLTGSVPGQLTIMARPSWDSESGEVRLTDLGFVFDAQQADQDLAAGLFYERIRAALDRAVNTLLQANTDGLRDRIQAALTRTLGPALPVGATLDVAGVVLRDLVIEIGEDGLRFKGSAGGSLQVAVGEGGS